MVNILRAFELMCVRGDHLIDPVGSLSFARWHLRSKYGRVCGNNNMWKIPVPEYIAVYLHTHTHERISREEHSAY